MISSGIWITSFKPWPMWYIAYGDTYLWRLCPELSDYVYKSREVRKNT